MDNVLTFDLEDWNDSFYAKRGAVRNHRLSIGLNVIREELNDKNIKATFFVVGALAEKFPEVIRMLLEEGHEIASHGYLHLPVDSMSPEEFEEDLLKSIKIIKLISGKEPIGYRAPGYTITNKTLWALDIISKVGLKYDSSIYPVSLKLFTKGGASDYPLRPFIIRRGLFELPLITMNVLGQRLPVATTSYFRIFPFWITQWAIRQYNLRQIPATLNYHTWEFDQDQPIIKLPFPHNIKHYYNLNKTRIRLRRLLQKYKFITCQQALNMYKPESEPL